MTNTETSMPDDQPNLHGDLTQRAAYRFTELDRLRVTLADGDAELSARLANLEMGFLSRAAGIQADTELLTDDITPTEET